MKFFNFKMTIRNAQKNRVLTFAKLFGLSVSFAVVLFAASYVYFEMSFDRCIPGYNRIYRCLMQGQLNDERADYAVTSPAQAAAMKNEIPEIVSSVRILNQGKAYLKYDHKVLRNEPLFYADSNFFSFFSIPLKTSLINPLSSGNYLIIAKSMAQKLFGPVDNALGKMTEVNGEKCIITGVFDDLPKNFHLRIKLIQSLQKSDPDSIGWGSQKYYTYFKTDRPYRNVNALNFKITKLVYTHTDDRIDGAKAKNLNDLKYKGNFYLFYTCEPLKDIHFSSHKFDPAITANKLYVYGAILMSILVLLISSVNFINLTIASIFTRQKEVGLQKVMGASKRTIILQFLFETFLFFFVSFVFAAIIFRMTGGALAHYLGFEVFITWPMLVKMIACLFLILLIISLTACIIPVAFITNRSVLRLMHNESIRKQNAWGNYTLVLLQFILSGLIILNAVFVQKQINYLVHKDCGYNADNVLMFNIWGLTPATRRSFIEKLKTYGVVEYVATSDDYFGDDISMNNAYFETRADKNYFHASILPVDDQFLKAFQFKLTEGRFFDPHRKTDFAAVVMNESASREFNGKGSLIGKKVIIGNTSYHVIGIVRDFNFRSLRYKIEPLIMRRIENYGIVYVKIRKAHVAEVIGIMHNLWNEFKIDIPLDYTFHDEIIAQHYARDQQAKKILFVLSIISIVIACVGLYASSYFTIIRKTKEIGIRKVNGGLVIELITMLNFDFIKWVALAFLIACPLALYIQHNWLENFAYKTSLSWWVFALTGIVAMVIASLTVSFQSWKAATRNPVEALRYE